MEKTEAKIQNFKGVLILNSRVSVEKRITETWERQMVMRNAIFNGFSREGVAHIITDEKTTYKTHNQGGSGHYYFSAFDVQSELNL